MDDASEGGRTDGGRWIVVGGRRWRATDPSIPEPLRKELVAELMDARRAVGRALRVEDLDGEAQARARVQDAKVALGERGAPWWEEVGEDDRRVRLRAAVSALTRHRGCGSSICPSDAARAVGGDRWRATMGLAREEVRRLAAAGSVVVLRGGDPQDPSAEWEGPVRVRTTCTDDPRV